MLVSSDQVSPWNTVLLAHLPQRPPFRFLDRVASVDDSQIVGVYRFAPDAPFYAGHFPDWPLTPGVLLIETMAQTAGYLLLALNAFARMPFLIEVRSAKLRNFVSPGTVLDVAARLEHDGDGFAITKASITSDGRPVADAEIRFRTLAFPAPELERMMRENAARIGLAPA